MNVWVGAGLSWAVGDRLLEAGEPLACAVGAQFGGDLLGDQGWECLINYTPRGPLFLRSAWRWQGLWWGRACGGRRPMMSLG